MTTAPKGKKGGKKAILVAANASHKPGHHSHSKTNSKSRHKKG